MNCKNCKHPIRRVSDGVFEHTAGPQAGWEACDRSRLSDRTAEPDTDTLEGWLGTYSTESRVALDLDMSTWEDKHTPFIIIRNGDQVMILNPQALSSTKTKEPYLDVDVHSFVDGQDASTGVFGMGCGRRASFPEDRVEAKSVGWPATPLVVLLLGKQESVDD